MRLSLKAAWLMFFAAGTMVPAQVDDELVAATPANLKTNPERYIFVRKENWAESLLASRANYLQFVKNRKMAPVPLKAQARLNCLNGLRNTSLESARIVRQLEADVLRLHPERDKNGRPVALYETWFESEQKTVLEWELIR